MRLERWLLLAVLAALGACSETRDFSRGKETRRPTSTDAVDTRSDDSEAAKINIQLGQAYLSQGKLDMAMEKLKKGVALAPRNPDGHTVIAVLYEQLGDVEKAAKHYQEARKLAPESGMTANNLGRFLCSQGQYDKADALFEQALRDPFYRTPETALLNRGSCAMSAGRLDQAGEQLRLALEKSPNMPDALFQSALLAVARKDGLRARAFIERYLGMAGSSPQALALAIRIEEMLGATRSAASYRQRLVQEFPESAEADAIGKSLGSQ